MTDKNLKSLIMKKKNDGMCISITLKGEELKNLNDGPHDNFKFVDQIGTIKFSSKISQTLILILQIKKWDRTKIKKILELLLFLLSLFYQVRGLI